MFTHICISAADLDASGKFYEAALAPLGIVKVQTFEKAILFAAKDGPMLLVTKPADGGAATHSNGGTIGFEAASPEAVDAFHAAGLAAGGVDEGAPGVRPQAPNQAYGAYLRDPVGNKICAFTPFR